MEAVSRNFERIRSCLSRLVRRGTIADFEDCGKRKYFPYQPYRQYGRDGALSKPTVDILLELTAAASVALASERLKTEWILMSENREPLKLAFNKGYTEDGFAERVFHLHVRRAGDWDELYFRDYLRGHGETAEAYGRLKQELLQKYCHNRDAYTGRQSGIREKIYRRGPRVVCRQIRSERDVKICFG